jgi:hypothetical protein
MKIDWRSNLTISALHAAQAICIDKNLIDPRVHDALQNPTQSLDNWFRQLEPSGAPSKTEFWNVLIEQSLESDQPEQIAQQACKQIFAEVAFDSTTKNFIAGRIGEIQAAYAMLFPKFAPQLELRLRPIRELWDGWGPGIMAHVGRLTERRLISSQATVVGVQPVVGGAGRAYPSYQFATIEAVLTNPVAELPEVIRLAWLLAQLGAAQFAPHETAEPIRSPFVWALAMLPPVLAGSQIVELARIDEANVALAIEQWSIAIPDALTNPAQSLLHWWETYLQTRPSWEVALNAIDKMLD